MMSKWWEIMQSTCHDDVINVSRAWRSSVLVFILASLFLLPTPCPPLPPLDLIYPSKWGTLTSVKPDGVLSVLNVWAEWTHGKKIAFCKTAQIKAKKLSSEEQSQNWVLLTNPQPFLCEKFWKCCYYVLYVFSVILFSFVCRCSQETRTKILL